MKALWRFIKGVLKVAGFGLAVIIVLYFVSDWSTEAKLILWIMLVGIGLAYGLQSIEEKINTLTLKIDMLESSLDDRFDLHESLRREHYTPDLDKFLRD